MVAEPGIVPRARAGANSRISDLGGTCAPYEDEEAFLTDPVLLVERLSPSNTIETWSDVWTYTTIPSVQEILVVSSDAIGAE